LVLLKAETIRILKKKGLLLKSKTISKKNSNYSSSVGLLDDLNDSDQELEIQMETYRNIKKDNKGFALAEPMNLDLTKAKNLQHTIAKTMIEDKNKKPGIKIIELEDANRRLTDLVQKVLEENEKLKKQEAMTRKGHAVISAYNKKLCNLVNHYSQKLKSSNSLLKRYSNVYSFFQEFYSVAARNSEDIETKEMFKKIYEGLQRYNLSQQSEVFEEEQAKFVLTRNPHQFSFFQTI